MWFIMDANIVISCTSVLHNSDVFFCCDKLLLPLYMLHFVTLVHLVVFEIEKKHYATAQFHSAGN
uniref:Uncharacterized protein n=1 Tax=Arundo donax TaxID=35708 RepID=A0A0A9FJK6_ARUDO